MPLNKEQTRVAVRLRRHGYGAREIADSLKLPFAEVWAAVKNEQTRNLQFRRKHNGPHRQSRSDAQVKRHFARLAHGVGHDGLSEVMGVKPESSKQMTSIMRLTHPEHALTFHPDWGFRKKS